MRDDDNQNNGRANIGEEAVEMLQQLGLKEYEAKCFVALTRVDSATAREVSEIADVPRTRVYDATRVLEAQGLAEVQHTNPQRFRAVSIEEAIETLRDRYESRMQTLDRTLRDLGTADTGEESMNNEVWSLSGTEAIANRTERLLGEASEEVFLVVGVEDLLTSDLIETLERAAERGVSVIVGATTPEMRERIESRVPGTEVFVSGLEWLHGPDDEEVAIGRLLLVDRQAILVSSYDPDTAGEQVVFGQGFENGLVVLFRRLIATGFLQGAGGKGASD